MGGDTPSLWLWKHSVLLLYEAGYSYNTDNILSFRKKLFLTTNLEQLCWTGKLTSPVLYAAELLGQNYLFILVLEFEFLFRPSHLCSGFIYNHTGVVHVTVLCVQQCQCILNLSLAIVSDTA